MKKIQMRLFIFSLLFFFLFVPVAHSDLYWESTIETGGAPEGILENMPKQIREQMAAQFKPKTETVKNYLTSFAIRSEQKDHIMILNYDTVTMYQIDSAEKTYTMVNILDFMEQMDQGMSEDTEITPTNETKKIAGYQCKKIIVTAMGMKSEHWLSKDVKGYKEYKAVTEKMEKKFDKSPSMTKIGVSGISSKEGFPVRTVTDMMGVKSTTTLKTIEKKSLNKNLFKIPEGYKLIEMKIPLQ
jgi:hypothetical protein